jgi:hypothetical protein
MTEQQIETEIDAAIDQVEERCTPDKMSKSEAVDYLEGVIARLRTSVEALEEEIGNAGDEA